ncbi:CAMK/CAMKL protein kinase [Saprolegnia diclina VS20]|uniref:CAMK/CAMKL protein kinase n=1 Tax=Saprolegnia diclina (strain VS20) TaxID=1156394 RepID=T0SAL3_SAPDV|nr:CAMK/CAMKL protein kinase [Saprolegnia diclina VS20]EQC42378.1 CAMK/CAMKL protein kinase [Saprolegnia diclina VS20]|eukprot:XP_008603801.1 CAMK/CAMKL protein kinase [Saprolegnia diclina VS20]
MDAYTLVEKVADAIYGQVLLCKENATGRLVVIKQTNLAAMRAKRACTTQRKVAEDGEMEKTVYTALSARGGHTNVLSLLDSFDNETHSHLVFDHCKFGELYNVLVDAPESRFGLRDAQAYFRQIVRGVSFLHASGYAHRDLSLENVLVDAKKQCRVMDFGLAVPIAPTRHECVGKLFYMAPEVYQGVAYQPLLADMWSLGILLYIMLTGAPPIESTSVDDERYRVLHTSGIRALVKVWHLGGYFSPDALDVVDGLLQVNPVKRMTTHSLLHHPFLQKELDAREHTKATSGLSLETLLAMLNLRHPDMYKR